MSIVRKGSKGFFDKLAELYAIPEFQEFVQQYCTTYSETQSVIMLLKVYELVDLETDRKKTPEEIVALVKVFMGNSEFRAVMMAAWDEYTHTQELYHSSFKKLFNSLLPTTTEETKSILR